MKRSEFAEQLLELMNTTDEALTTREMAEAVGCSAQRAYVWVKDNRGELVATGTDPHGGTLFIGRHNTHAPAGSRPVSNGAVKVGVVGLGAVGSHSAGAIEVGTQMTIRRLMVGDGVQVELETKDGRVIEATLHI